MKKCKKANEDPYLGLLNLRNTPQEGLLTSPVQRLMGRRTRTAVPTSAVALKPRNINNDQERSKMTKRRAAAAERYTDRRQLKPLVPGDVVRMQPIQAGKREWREAVVTSRLKSRTYEVATSDGWKYTRNRQFLRSSPGFAEKRDSSPAKIDVAPQSSKSAEKPQSPAAEVKIPEETPAVPQVLQGHRPTQVL